MKYYKNMCWCCYYPRPESSFKKHVGYTSKICDRCVRAGRPRRASKELQRLLDSQSEVEELKKTASCVGCGVVGHKTSWLFFWERDQKGGLQPFVTRSPKDNLRDLKYHRFLCGICQVHVGNRSLGVPFFRNWGTRYEDLL